VRAFETRDNDRAARTGRCSRIEGTLSTLFKEKKKWGSTSATDAGLYRRRSNEKSKDEMTGKGTKKGPGQGKNGGFLSCPFGVGCSRGRKKYKIRFTEPKEGRTVALGMNRML